MKIIGKIIFAFIFVGLVACNKLERFNGLRITNLDVLEDSLSAIVTGEIIDIQTDKNAIDHGFCYAANFADPRIGNSDTVSLGLVVDANLNFKDSLLNLSPSTIYYVRPYLMLDSTNIIYGAVSSFRTRDFTIDDLPFAITNALVTFPVGDLTVSGFVNQKKIEEENPIDVLYYGTIVSREPDSTATNVSLSIFDATTEDIIRFTHSHPSGSIPSPTNTLPPELENKYFIWVFADAAPITNPTNITRYYSQRKVVSSIP